jgi:hypothetical protein
MLWDPIHLIPASFGHLDLEFEIYLLFGACNLRFINHTFCLNEQ